MLDAAAAAAAACRKGGRRGTVAPYIKISEEEIADDYPLPKNYVKEHEETDELVLFEDDMMELDPEYLPKRWGMRGFRV